MVELELPRAVICGRRRGTPCPLRCSFLVSVFQVWIGGARADPFIVHVSGRALVMHAGHTTDRNYPDWLNLIQHLPAEKHGHIFMTLNPPSEPDPKLVFKEFVYDHPVLDANVNIRSPHSVIEVIDRCTSIGCLPPAPDPHDPKHTRDLLRRSVAELRLPRRRLHIRPSDRRRRHPERSPTVRDR